MSYETIKLTYFFLNVECFYQIIFSTYLKKALYNLAMPYIGNTLKQLRDNKNLTQEELSNRADIPLNTIMKLEQNKRAPREKLIKKLCIFFKISEEDLLISADYLSKKNFEIKKFTEAQMPVNKIPLVSWVSANRFSEASDSFAPGDAEEWVYTTAKGGRMFALKVKNDCMEPEFREGERIIIDPDTQVENGDFVVVRDNKNDEATFKQLKKYGKKIILHPLNPKYDDIELDQDKRYVIVGKVVGKDKKY